MSSYMTYDRPKLIIQIPFVWIKILCGRSRMIYTCSTETFWSYDHLHRSMYIVYDETENHNNFKVYAIVRIANFKVVRNLVSESLYEEISFYSFLGTRILSSYSKAILLLSYHCVIRRER
jgi:hypothetical protein